MEDKRKVLWIDGDKDAAEAVRSMDDVLQELLKGHGYDFKLEHHLVVPKPLPDQHDYRALVVEPRPIYEACKQAPGPQQKTVLRAHPLYALMMAFYRQYKEVIVNTSLFEAELEDTGLREGLEYTMFFGKHGKSPAFPLSIAHSIKD